MYTIRPMTEPDTSNYSYDLLHGIVPNSVIRSFEYGQNFYTISSATMLTWLTEFADRKKLRSDYGARLIPVDPNARYIPEAAPRNLPLYLGLLPRINLATVLYSALFVMPVATLVDVDTAAIGQELRISGTRAEPVSAFLTSTANESHQADFQKIIMAMLLPGQVMVSIKSATTLTSTMQAFSALCAKLLFSTTRNLRNIDGTSEVMMNEYIIHWLQTMGAIMQGRTVVSNASLPLPPYGIYTAMAPLWRAVIGDPNIPGDGWINTNCGGSFTIQNPLYSGITDLPRYADISVYTAVGSTSGITAIPNTPMFTRIKDALASTSTSLTSNRIIFTQISSLLTYLELNYRTSLSMINEHIASQGTDKHENTSTSFVKKINLN